MSPALDIRHLTVVYRTERGPLEAVRDASLRIEPGQTMGLVGESGSGKTTLALAALGYLPAGGQVIAGEALIGGVDMTSLSRAGRRRMWGSQVALVSQNPQNAFNPSMPLGRQLDEVGRRRLRLSRGDARRTTLAMLEKVAMPDAQGVVTRYPHQLSGGMLQRCALAMALMADPRVLILDEPTTALDVTTQATILDLLEQLKSEMDSALLYITHNLGVVAQVCDRVSVMLRGEIVEEASVDRLFAHPSHAYTAKLLAAVPRFDPDAPPPPGQGDEGASAPGAQPPAGAGPQPAGAHFLELRDLVKQFPGGEGLHLFRRRPQLRAVDHVSLWAARGTTLGLVGESGSGKTTLAQLVVGLKQPDMGEVDMAGERLPGLAGSRRRPILRQIQMVFQNPDASLNPRHTVGQAIGRPLRLLQGMDRGAAHAEAARLLEAVRLPTGYLDRYPGELSGGEIQRVAIARALAARPQLLVCDEPVSSLDVSVQGALLDLFKRVQLDAGLAYLFISHDLAAVQTLSHRIAVMYLGALMEYGEAARVLRPPYHPYTEALVSAIPTPDPAAVHEAVLRLRGGPSNPADVPSGCRFHTRCPRFLGDICRQQEPPWREGDGDHHVYCHIPLEELLALQKRPEPPAAGAPPSAEAQEV